MVWHGGHLQSSIFIFILTYAVAYSRVNIATSLQHTVVAGLNHSWTPSPRYFPVGLATTPSPKRKHPSRTPWSPCMYVCNGGPDVSRHAGKTKSGYAAWRAGEDRGRDGGVDSWRSHAWAGEWYPSERLWVGSASLACLLAGMVWMAIYEGSRHRLDWKCRILQDLVPCPLHVLRIERLREDNI